MARGLPQAGSVGGVLHEVYIARPESQQGREGGAGGDSWSSSDKAKVGGSMFNLRSTREFTVSCLQMAEGRVRWGEAGERVGPPYSPAGQAEDGALYPKCSAKLREGFQEQLENDSKFILWKDQNGCRLVTGLGGKKGCG